MGNKRTSQTTHSREQRVLNKLTEVVDEIFVNGDSFIPYAKAPEPLFKARMFAPVEA